MQQRSFIEKVWDFFCSLKLTIFILIALAVTSIIGTIIPQAPGVPPQYLASLSPFKQEIYFRLGFFNMYHSLWFLGLLGVFATNLIACSIKRIPRAWKLVNEPMSVPVDGFYGTLANSEQFTSRQQPAEIRDALVPFIASSFTRPKVIEEGGRIHLLAQRFSWARLGVYVTHLSIVIIFIGAIVGTVFGYKAFMTIPEGEGDATVYMRKLVTVDVGGRQLLTEQPVPVDLGFALHCDDFSVSFYDNGMPKEYKSIITVLKEGKPVQGYSQVQVIVNDPLSYGGINFYQSSYGYVTENPWFKITVTSRRDGASSQVKVHQGERFSLPGGGFARVLEATDEVSSFYPAFRGPALRLEQTLPGSRPEVVMLMLNYPDFDQQRSGSLGYTLNDFQMYTGLQVAKDPGVGVVWLGCILMVLGILIAFFLSHQRIWLTIENAGGKSRVSFGGVAHRNQPAFEQLFSTLREGINSRI